MYERALQRSIMLRGTSKQGLQGVTETSRGVGRLPGTTKSTYLATMKEADDGLEEEAEADGWETKMVHRQDADLELSRGEADQRNNGVLDMLQDVMRR